MYFKNNNLLGFNAMIEFKLHQVENLTMSQGGKNFNEIGVKALTVG